MPPSPPRVDSALLRELAEAERTRAPAQAVVTLRRPDPAQLPTPEQTEAAARRVIEHAETETGERAAALNVFRNLNAFAARGFARLHPQRDRPRGGAVRPLEPGPRVGAHAAPEPLGPANLPALTPDPERGILPPSD